MWLRWDLYVKELCFSARSRYAILVLASTVAAGVAATALATLHVLVLVAVATSTVTVHLYIKSIDFYLSASQKFRAAISSIRALRAVFLP